ncbi:MAG: hypothetical protein WCA78_14510 [Rhizomicrobium sp.]
MKTRSWIAGITLAVAMIAGLAAISATAQDSMRDNGPMMPRGSVSQAEFDRLQRQVNALEQRVAVLEKAQHHGSSVTGKDDWHN